MVATNRLSRGQQYPGLEPLSPILSLKFCLQTQLQAALASVYPTLGLEAWDIPLSPQITPLQLRYHCALALKLSPRLGQSPTQILTTLWPWLPRQCCLPGPLLIPLQLETTAAGGIRLALAYGDLEPWWQALTADLVPDCQGRPRSQGIAAPEPWSAYQYTHARLSHWLRLLVSSPSVWPPASLCFSTWASSMQALLGQELALIDHWAEGRGLTSPGLDNLCATVLAVIDAYPLTRFQAEPTLQAALVALFNLARYLLAQALTQQGPYDAPTEL